MLEDTYVDMDIALPRDGEVSDFSKVTKYLRDENVIPIVRHRYNPIVDIRVYEVEYLHGHKASLASNTISENIFSQVDEEVNILVIFDDIVDHSVYGTETMHQDALIVSKNGGNRGRENNKGWKIMIQWKDGSTTWERMKYINENSTHCS